MSKPPRRPDSSERTPTVRPTGAVTTQTVVAAWQGPLPAPNDLAAYDRVVPGAAERIIGMAETQGAHRRAIETRPAEAAIRAQHLGLWLGFVVTMTAIGGGIYLVSLGANLSGVATIMIALGGLVSAFIFGRERMRRERAIKRAGIAQA